MTPAPATRRAASPHARGRSLAPGLALAAALASGPAAAAPADTSAGAGAGPSDRSDGAAGAAVGPVAGAGAGGSAGASDRSTGGGAGSGAAVPADSKAVPADSKATPAIVSKAQRPPRVDGTYVGGTVSASLGFARVNDIATPDPFTGGVAGIRVGEVLYPWMSVGVEIAGNMAYRFADPRQRQISGAFLVDFGFYPAPKIPLSLRAGFGAGGGAVREQGRPKRSGFGGAVFTAAVRYEIFPLAARRRPKRGGGFALGPELGWIGFMPAAKGRPMEHTLYLGLFMGFYFGS